GAIACVCLGMADMFRNHRRHGVYQSAEALNLFLTVQFADTSHGDDAAVRVRLDRGATVSVQRTEWNKYEYALEVDSNSGYPVIRQHESGVICSSRSSSPMR
ncbi:MAG: hypothetical protein IKJ45_13995, partial [Kiritimatiellae bacterium]|nr:hypothetical protein [Kiritimatiellia bacterium]